MEYEFLLIGLAVVFGFYMAWNIGANDVANAMGTSVGSGALTLKRAVIFAAVLEFAGAFLVGSHVSETVRKGIVSPDLFVGEPLQFALGMLSALLAAGVWLQIASYKGWPVSTTHSIVGAVIGFGIVYGGLEAIDWVKTGNIVASWVVSPLTSGIISYAIFRLLQRKIFHSYNPVAAAKRITPLLVFLVFVILTFVMLFKGLKNLKLDLSLSQASLVACIVGLVAAVVGRVLVARIKDQPAAELPVRPFHEQSVSRALRKAQKHVQRIRHSTTGPMHDKVQAIALDLKSLDEQIPAAPINRGGPDSEPFRTVERIFIYLQILSACFVAFAHGANDVANAIGPLAAVVQTVRANAVLTDGNPVPLWALALGGFGIVVGLATWGWRVMETVGRRITELTPSRGFAAEFGAATTIVVASRLGLPISTTHTLVGAVIGVGMARGIGALNLRTVRDIVISWLITVPAGGLFAVGIYLLLRMVFA
jgi:phosphate/sulfate permease